MAEATAKVIGVRTSARTHSLDVPGQDVRAAFKAVEAALVLDGQAVVVAHGNPDTLTALGPWLDDLKRRNIHLFRLSEVVLSGPRFHPGQVLCRRRRTVLRFPSPTLFPGPACCD